MPAAGYSPFRTSVLPPLLIVTCRCPQHTYSLTPPSSTTPDSPTRGGSRGLQKGARSHASGAVCAARHWVHARQRAIKVCCFLRWRRSSCCVPSSAVMTTWIFVCARCARQQVVLLLIYTARQRAMPLPPHILPLLRLSPSTVSLPHTSPHTQPPPTPLAPSTQTQTGPWLNFTLH